MSDMFLAVLEHRMLELHPLDSTLSSVLYMLESDRLLVADARLY